MHPTIKVNNVTLPEEAKRLDSLGVEYLAISFSMSSLRNEGSRPLMEYEAVEKNALEIRSCLKKSRLVGQLPAGLDKMGVHLASLVDFVKKFGLSALQFSNLYVPPLLWRNTFRDMSIPIFYSDISVSYDDDPSWALSPFEDISDLNLSFFEIQLLPTVPSAWNFLFSEACKYPDELQIEDLDMLATKYPMLLALDFSKENFHDILDRFKYIRGYLFTINKHRSDQINTHLSTLDEIIKILS